MPWTERGSFVITALSRVPPRLPSSTAVGELALEQPFERKVTEQLARALNAASTAAIAAIAAAGSLTAFEEVVPQGVSADLCDAIVQIGAKEHEWGDVEIAISWAPSYPGNRALPAGSRFSPDTAPILQEAVLALRSGSPTCS